MADPESPEDAFERGKRVQLAADVEALRGKVDEMRLHDDTGDPRDEGYMGAISELDEWLALERTFGAGAEPQEEEPDHG